MSMKNVCKMALPLVLLAVTGCAATQMYSTDTADMTLYPKTTGPTDQFRPLLNVKQTRISGIGTGNTFQEASERAVFEACKRNNCDYITAAKKNITVENGWFSNRYTVELIGYPVFIEGVEQIKAVPFYKNKEGVFERGDKFEQRYILEYIPFNATEQPTGSAAAKLTFPSNYLFGLF